MKKFGQQKLGEKVPGLGQAVAAGDFLPGLSGIGQFLPVFLSIPLKVISKHMKK